MITNRIQVRKASDQANYYKRLNSWGCVRNSKYHVAFFFYINMPQCKNTIVYYVLFAMCEKVTTMNITIAVDPFDN